MVNSVYINSKLNKGSLNCNELNINKMFSIMKENISFVIINFFILFEKKNVIKFNNKFSVIIL